MSDAAEAFLAILREHVATIVTAGGAIGGGVIGYMSGRRKNDAEALKLEADAEGARVEALIAPFKALIDGYEAQAKADNARIEDLTREVRELREEVKSLRQALDARSRNTPST